MKNAFYSLLVAATIVAVGCMGAKEVTVDAKEEVKAEVVEETTGKRPAADVSPGKISWKAANQRYSAEGTFRQWKFTKVDMPKGEITKLNADIAIDLTSIWEKSPKLTDHLKAPDYFGVDQFSTATLNISNVQPKGDGYEADLALSMRKQTQNMKCQFVVVSKKPMTVKGTAKVDRGLFGIGAENTSVENLIEVTFEAIIPQ